jgi:hypothetical protein
VETVLSWEGSRAGRQRSPVLTGKVHLPELHAEISFRGSDGNGNGNGNGHAEEQWSAAAITPHRCMVPIPIQHLALPAGRRAIIWALTPDPKVPRHRPMALGRGRTLEYTGPLAHSIVA